MPKSKEEYFNSEMEHFESLRNGINNPPIPSMSQQSNAASDTTADTNDMANLRQVIPGSQQPLSQLSERSEGDDINAMFSQTSNNNELSTADRNARRSRWAEKEERAAAESNNPIEKMRAAAWSKVEDAPTTTNTNTNNTNTTNNPNNNNSTPSWADRISGVTKDVLVGNNTNTTTTTTTNIAATGDLGDLAKSPTKKKNIQNVNDKMSSLLGNNSPTSSNNKEEGDLLSPTNWAPINSSEEQSTGHNIPPRWAMSRDKKTNDDLYGRGGWYDNSSRHAGQEAWMNDINTPSRDDDLIDPSNPPGRDKMLSMFDNTANDDNSSSTSSGLPGESPEGDNLFPTDNNIPPLPRIPGSPGQVDENGCSITMVVGDENSNTSFNDAKSKLANHFNPNNNCPLPQRIDNNPNYVENNQPIRLPNSLTSSSYYGPAAAAGHVDNNDDDVGLPALTSSSDNEPKKKTKTISVKRKRATGLGNLGNTCFMNSTLQCLAHTPPLRHYFLSGQYKNDLNVDNPLGTGGELAKEFANLLREMWLEEQSVPSEEEGEGSSSTMVVGDDDSKDVSSSSLTNGGENGIYSSSRKYSYGNGGSMHYSNNTTSSYGGSGDVTYPRSFKTTLGKHASRFVGYDQHDSQELAIYLLDALHEDMNRIRKKPYVEKPEQGEDESDVDAAAKAWSAHKQREDSAIQENFMGLIKSRLVCPEEECGRVSTTFDPCMYMSVPIPGSTDRQMKVTFVPLPVAGGHTTGADMIIKVCKNSTLKDLRASVAERAREAYNFTGEGLKEEDVQFADIWSNKVWSFLNDMDSSIDSIKDRDVTYAYQVFPLDKVKEEVVAYKAKKEKEEQEKKQTPPSEDSNSSDNDLASRSLSPSGELDPLTKADLDIGDRWTVALEKYLSQPMTLSRLTATARATDQERSQFYVQLLRFVSKCKDCSDAKPLEEEKKSSEEDGKVTLEEASHMSKQFKNVNTPKDLAIFEYCMGKFMKMMQERKKKEKEEKNEDEEEKTKNEDGVVVQIQIRKSDTTISHYGHNPYSSSSGRSKTSWKLVGDAPIVARISPTLSVSGLREMLGRRLACGALKLNSDEHHSNGDGSLPSPELSVMNQVALSWEEKANSRFGLAALGTVTLDQLAENSKTPVFANPSDKEEKELVTEIIDDGCIIVVDWPTQLNDILDADLLSTSQEYLTAEQQKEKEDEANKKNGVSVMDCIAKYCEREQLDQDDAWYCNQCKEHVRAWKQFSMYTPPPILIVHLKRFHYSQTTHRRDKIDTLIDFPLTDLDLRGVVKHSNWDHEPIYDCYAVSNHFGGLGGGHYTAYARGDDGTWSNFDDSRVTSNVDESEVVSKAAYCLYYKRKDIVFDKDDDVRMTTDEDMDPHVINRFLMPVSPGPSPDIDNNDTMDTASQTSTTEAASYATPCGSLNGEPSMDESEALPQNNVIVDDGEIFSDAEAELGQSLYRQ